MAKDDDQRTDLKGKREAKRARNRRANKVILSVLGGVASLLLLLVIIAAVVGSDSSPSVAASAPSASAPSSAPVTPVAASESPSASAANSPAPADDVRQAILKAIGSNNRDGAPTPDVSVTGQDGEQIDVTFPANDNLTEGMIVTGMAGDVQAVLEATRTKATWNYDAIRIRATFPRVDAMGNSTEDMIFAATYPKSTVDQINFAGFSYKNVGRIGRDVYEDVSVAKHLN